jgi:hypothetical protein
LDFFYLILPFFVGNAMMVSHSGERHRSVKRHPFAWKDPIEKIVQFFADQETQAGSQISHLKKKKILIITEQLLLFLRRYQL